MPVQFRTHTISVPNGTGRRSIEGVETFATPVVRAGTAINGFKLDYSSDDHHINVVEVDVDVVSVSGNAVTFRTECHYADKNFDDSYSGSVQVLVIAEVR